MIVIFASTLAQAATLTVEATNVDPRPGQLVVRVFASADGWLTPEAAVRTAVLDPKKRQSVAFDDLPAGRYAVAIVHDENGNQKMDLAWFPYPHPAEGGGVSNDARPRLGPPSFAGAVFDFEPPSQSVTIALRY